MNHGFVLSSLGHPDRAMEKYKQVVRLDPIDTEGHFNLAVLYMDKKDFPAAIPHLEDVLRTDPNNVGTRIRLARIYVEQGNKELARLHLRAVFNSSPGNSEATQAWQELGL